LGFLIIQRKKRKNEKPLYPSAIALMLTTVLNGVMPKNYLHKTTTMEKCKHLSTRLKVLSVTATCETTVVICSSCKKELEKPKTDCA